MRWCDKRRAPPRNGLLPHFASPRGEKCSLGHWVSSFSATLKTKSQLGSFGLLACARGETACRSKGSVQCGLRPRAGPLWPSKVLSLWLRLSAIRSGRLGSFFGTSLKTKGQLGSFVLFPFIRRRLYGPGAPSSSGGVVTCSLRGTVRCFAPRFQGSTGLQGLSGETSARMDLGGLVRGWSVAEKSSGSCKTTHPNCKGRSRS